ncbi:uncharacterized protein N7459_003527 [Penicillium hispanicum]|uniref:uncharacterized protein n=1 Tax=Penicillium hispanicum TaxID=1080232 RepID=UPI002541D103|nr:uncharacterized protein N7459_003527 [Penicillium hispanicum]KAJ5587762.1 hypothetical protein N7459_003527 [Penicillium hispanicum]
MSLQWISRAGVLRHLHRTDALSRPTRVIGVQNQLRQLSLVSNPRLTTPRAALLPSIVSQRSHSYATKSTTPKSKSPRKSSEGKRKKQKRVLTEEQLEKKKKREQKQHIRELKKVALKTPKMLPELPFPLAFQANYSQIRGQYKDSKEAFKAVASLVRSLGPEERERFQTQAEENRAANQASYAAWVNTHTPNQIRDANTARRNLARILDKSLQLIKDERLVKKPATAFALFCKDRHASGDLKHMSMKDSSARITEEWKSMTDAEKSRYFQSGIEERERYAREYREVYGEELPSSRRSSQPESEVE